MWNKKSEDDNYEQEPLNLLDLPDNLRNDFVKMFVTPEEYFTEDY